MEMGSCPRGSIAAKAEATSAVGLDFAGPLSAEDNGTRRWEDGIAKHAEVVELVKLFEFGSMP